MSIKIAALADIHFASRNPAACPQRRSAIADTLLLRTVHRLNRYIKPDVVVVLGDLIDDGQGADAEAHLRRLKDTLDLLQAPVIALPGNHDGDIERFYRIFPRPEQMIDLHGVRFLPFLDPEEPGYHARRTDNDLARMTAARADFEGPIVSLQHVPLFPAGESACPYHLTNAEEVIAAIRRAGITLAISGHYHEGDNLMQSEAGNFIIVPALCESPFPFLEIDLDGEQVHVTRHELRMPPKLRLVDYHTHTQFAYCGEKNDMPVTLALAEAFGLAGVAFSEHSGQLYFDSPTYWSGAFLPEGVACRHGVANRMEEYLTAASQYAPPAILGLEMDCDYTGNPVVRPEDAACVSLRVGAVHQLAALSTPQPDLSRAEDEFLASVTKFIASGIHILAHPFRVFRRAKQPLPERLFAPVAQLLREHGVAAEINYHTNEPPPEFVSLCINSGVKLTFGSDAHNRYEVGEFAPHLALLRQCGYNGDLADILADITPEGQLA